jgi:ABC-type amino acid transport substrate-binding protein
LALLLTLAPQDGAAQIPTDWPTLTPGTLTACLPRNAGVVAGRRLTGGSGFEYALAKAVAAEMGLSLQPVWYEAELQEESDPLRETYAMLWHGLCDVVPGHPRYARAVGAPSFERAALPRWLGMPQDLDPATGHFADRLAGFVDVGPIAVSSGYMRSEIGLVYRDGTPEPLGLDDLAGRDLAFQQGTLSGAIAMTALGPEDRARAHHHNPGASFLWEVESSGAQIALVDVATYDSHLKANPFTPLKLAAWRHPLGMDIGMAVAEPRAALLPGIDAALASLAASGVLAALAEAEGLTYAPPRSDGLAPPFTLQTLLSGQ